MVARNFWKHSAQKASFSHLKLGSEQAPTGYSMSFQKAINISMASSGAGLKMCTPSR